MPLFSRRRFLADAAAVAAASALPLAGRARAQAIATHRLAARPARVTLIGPPHPDTEVWAYNGTTPGPVLRVRQGDRLRVEVANALEADTTVHWHGIRLPHAMDGVPHLTQPPIRPGESFVYEFECADAGTFWYHPHAESAEQLGRGLCGALIVEEREPVPVDRDLTWVLSDWRLDPTGAIVDNFGDLHDASHDGRLGNTVTINGRIPETFAVRAGERLRLRLINVANARIFALDFADHAPAIVALDGHPVAPHAPPEGRIVLGPGMRADIVLDCNGRPGSRATVADRFPRADVYRVVDLVYAEAPAVERAQPLAPVALPANPVAEPDLGHAVRHAFTFGGGMMGTLRTAQLDGRRVDMRTLMQNGFAWAVNGAVERGHAHKPLVTLKRNASTIFEFVNDTAWWHPIHLHGHTFRVVSQNGRPTRHREWRDTVLLPPRERAEVAFVADNPGDWMLHCHVLEHQASGMSSVIRVA